MEITLRAQADDVLDAFEKSVARIPDVLECHLMAGQADYLLKVVAEDAEDFARIHRRYLASLPGVQGCSLRLHCGRCARRRRCRFSDTLNYTFGCFLEPVGYQLLLCKQFTAQ